MSYELTWLPDVLLGAGLKVAEVDGWRDRGRSSMSDVKGVICHFTNGASRGNMPSLNVLIRGRTDLPGPLAQLGLGRDGTYYVVAAGRCNHAGRGAWQGIEAGNSHFIGIEAENTGKGEPWPDVQMNAYMHGVAAILRHVGAPEIMCCGHKEWALPQGRKDDPDFDMSAFRRQVGSILRNESAPLALIPVADTTGRPTLRRGSRGALVARLQALLDLPADGIFGPQTEAGVRSLQRASGLVPDGIVGPNTWSALDRIGVPPIQIRRAGGEQEGETAVSPASLPNLDLILSIAEHSQVALYDWRARGRAPLGYIKGLAVMFARLLVRLQQGDPIVAEIAKAPGTDPNDTLVYYADEFRDLGMVNRGGDADTLRHVFALLMGLGMRESSGRFCEGRDLSATNTKAETAEAGLFQTSFNSSASHPMLKTIFEQYKARGPELKEIFREGVRVRPDDMLNFGSGDGLVFQELSKTSPAFAVEYCALAIRATRPHWGPLTRKHAELRPEADELFRAVAEVV